MKVFGVVVKKEPSLLARVLPPVAWATGGFVVGFFTGVESVKRRLLAEEQQQPQQQQPQQQQP